MICRLRTVSAVFYVVTFLFADGVVAGGFDAVGKDEISETEGTQPVNFLFIHHSCGGQLLADPGPKEGEHCIYTTHPNSGGMRSMLEAAGFTVNEASYQSIIGQDTDICHWNSKFRDHMDRILRTQYQDGLLPEGETNQIVAFKSCYPNNKFIGRGRQPGDPDSCELTIANAKAAYRALLPHFSNQPEVLFVAFTAPPLARPIPVGIKAKIKAFFVGTPKWADLAREFNTWLVDREHGWLSEYHVGNVVVFDYYDLLTDNGATNWAAYPTQNGHDSHPSSEGNRRAAEAFVPFVQEAWSQYQELGSRAGAS